MRAWGRAVTENVLLGQGAAPQASWRSMCCCRGADKSTALSAHVPLLCSSLTESTRYKALRDGMGGFGSVQRPVGFPQQQEFPLSVCRGVLTAGLFSLSETG